MDILDTLMSYIPNEDPFICAYEDWLETGTVSQDPKILLHGGENDRHPFPVQMSDFIRRDAFVSRFGFCAPRPALIAFLKDAGPVLEIGAGRGFISRLLKISGGQVRATDISPTSSDVEAVDARQAISQDDGASLIFCSWPSLEGDWFGEALHSMRKGQKLLYVGEGAGGATASDTFFSQIGAELEPVDLPRSSDFNIRFAGIHDRASLFVRR